MAEKKLTNIEVISLIQELKQMEKVKAPKPDRAKIFRQIPKEFTVTVCLGCGKRYESSNCGCPAGSAENLRDATEITKILMARMPGELKESESDDYQIVEPNRGFEMNMAYPQYKENYDQEDIISVNTWIQLQSYVVKRLNDKTFGPSTKVRRHMVLIANGFIPYNMRITTGFLAIPLEKNQL